VNYEDIVNGLTTSDVKKVMETFYKDPNIVDVVFVPQEEAALNSTGEYLLREIIMNGLLCGPFFF
jgi:hypothetical protein